MSTTYGYARVSSKEQNNDRQIIALNQFGVDRIFIDYQSGKNFDRPQYKKLLRKLKAKDVFLVKSIDRLGRNYNTFRQVKYNYFSVKNLQKTLHDADAIVIISLK